MRLDHCNRTVTQFVREELDVKAEVFSIDNTTTE